MAGACLCFLLLFQLASFGTLAPAENDKTHVKKTPANDDSVLKSPLDSSALIKPSESMQPQSGAASLDFPQKSDSKETENLPAATESSQLRTSVSDSDTQKPNVNEVKQGEDLSARSQSLHSVPESSSLKLEAKKTENLISSIEKKQSGGVVPEFSSQRSDHNEANQNEPLPSKSKTLQSDASVVDSSHEMSEHNEANHNGNLLDKSKSPLSDSAVSESPPQKSDQDEANKNENLQIKSQILQSNASVVDSSLRNSDHNEANQNEKFATKSKTIQSDTSVAVFPPQKSEHNGANPNENLAAKFRTPDTGAAILESSLQKSKHNEANQNENLPSAAENNPADIFVPKDDDMDGDNIVDDDEDGKVGEKVGGASQSEKDDAKNSPSDPIPKNGSENSHFFAYLVTTAIVVAALYIAYHNKRKIIAFALEGKKSKVIRRPKSSDYQRLDQKI